MIVPIYVKVSLNLKKTDNHVSPQIIEIKEDHYTWRLCEYAKEVIRSRKSKIVFPSSIYGFWLPLWYLRFTASDYLFGILDLRLLITSLAS
jgi:hypothetical protein